MTAAACAARRTVDRVEDVALTSVLIVPVVLAIAVTGHLAGRLAASAARLVTGAVGGMVALIGAAR